jgi:maleylacetoacetate isomerase
MIKMFGFWRSAAAFRVRVALNLKGLTYTEEMIDLDGGEQHAPDYLTLNPQASVPSLFVDDGPPLTQSLAILEYLEETHPDPALLPADARGRARVRSLALVVAADSHPLIVPRVRTYLTETLHVDDDMRRAWLRHWFQEGLDQLEARLSREPQTGAFCHGDQISIADLCLISQVMGARGFQLTTESLPTVHAITERLLEIEAVRRALPLRQPGAPAAH